MERQRFLGERVVGKERLILGTEIINFIGPEGSGKSTMAKMIAGESGKPYVSVGDILREMAANDPGELGEECREMFTHHRYMTPEILLRILGEGFKREDLKDGFVLDGGLRTIDETVGFWEMLELCGRRMPMTIIHLRVPGWLGVERLLGENGRKRSDDTIEGVLSRMTNFYTGLAQRASIIRSQEDCQLLHVDATGSVEETKRKVMEVLLRNNILGIKEVSNPSA